MIISNHSLAYHFIYFSPVSGYEMVTYCLLFISKFPKEVKLEFLFQL